MCKKGRGTINDDQPKMYSTPYFLGPPPSSSLCCHSTYLPSLLPILSGFFRIALEVQRVYHFFTSEVTIAGKVADLTTNSREKEGNGGWISK